MEPTKCKECGEEISAHTKVCPNCGKSQTNTLARWISGGIFLVIMFILYIIYWMSHYNFH
jgi:RNA polymerase subunit RPABC4/transcription elongation factor Spt4